MLPSEYISFTDKFIKFLSSTQGDVISGAELVSDAAKLIESIPGRIFYHNFKFFMEGLDTCNTVRRKIGEKLAESDYGDEYGYAILKYIGDFEHADKGTYLACLIDAATKDFITPNEAIEFARIIDRVSLTSLIFLRDNVEKKVLQKPENLYAINELKANNLVYDANSGGYAFELEAFKTNAYSISYLDDKSHRIPELNEFPDGVSYLVTGQGEPYRGWKKEDSPVEGSELVLNTK